MNETIKVGNTPDSSSASLSPPNSNGTGGGSGAPSGAVGVTVRNPLYSYRFQEGSVMYGWSPDNLKLNPQTERCVMDDKALNNGTATKRWTEPWRAEELMRDVGSQLRDSVVSVPEGERTISASAVTEERFIRRSPTNILLTYEISRQQYDLFVRPDPGQWGAGGFEGPHNTVHNNAGCWNGTMANVDWSAFDPLL